MGGRPIHLQSLPTRKGPSSSSTWAFNQGGGSLPQKKPGRRTASFAESKRKLPESEKTTSKQQQQKLVDLVVGSCCSSNRTIMMESGNGTSPWRQGRRLVGKHYLEWQDMAGVCCVYTTQVPRFSNVFNTTPQQPHTSIDSFAGQIDSEHSHLRTQ